jgi:Tol biopolymer transport system component
MVSPDGSSVALTINDPSEGPDIWIQDLASGARTRLTLGGSGWDPIWSPDGRRVAFVGSDRTLRVKQVGQDDPPEPILKMTTWGGPASWSPDGRFIAVWTFDPKTPNTFDASILSLEGDAKLIPIAATTAEEFAGTFTPDGRWLLYSSNASGRHEVYAISIPDRGRRQQISVGGGVGGIWKGQDEIWYRRENALVSVTIEEQGGALSVSQPVVLFSDPEIGGIDSPPGSDTIFAMRYVGKSEPPETVLVSNWPALLR